MANIGKLQVDVRVCSNSINRIANGTGTAGKNVLRFIIRQERLGKYFLFCKSQFEWLENVF